MRPLDARLIDIIEDDPLMGESLAQSLSLEGATIRWWRSGEEALAGLAEAPTADAIVCDIRLPDMSGEAVFVRLSRTLPGAPILFMTAYGEIDQAVRLMRLGAADYVTKPFEMEDFFDRLQALMSPRADDSAAVLGVSPAMRAVERLLARLAAQAGPVLITGETGVGKEVAARRLHELASPAAPFVAVNCAAIPAELLESELFGHERGAFTGAAQRHLGYAERARDGVLFLDEIGDMPLALQAKLLRLLDQRSFTRVGGESLVPFRARVVAATNRDLDAAVRRGAFRQDLLFRLNTFPIDLPPLRSRPDDIEWLLDRFFAAAGAEGATGLRGVSALARDAALAHDWPGNVRELRNRVERALALAVGDWLMPADLFPQAGAPRAEPGGPLADIRDAAERRAILSALRDTGGQMAETARLLGIARTTLWEKMKRLGIGA